MTDARPIVLYYTPHSRAVAIAVLLEELGAAYTTELLDLKAGDQRRPEFLAINPMGKVPTLRHGDAVITEQVAICLYLADLFPAAGLAPACDDPQRGPYLRWMVFYSSCLEPAVTDRALKREPVPAAASPYGDFDTMWAALMAQLAPGPWMLGDRFTAADVLWGAALSALSHFGVLPPAPPALEAYIGRFQSRPATQKVRERDLMTAPPPPPPPG